MFPVSFLAVSMLLLMVNNGYTATYYVATTGTDGNTCGQAQSVSTPKRTINNGIGCLASGDTLIIKGGTYEEYFCRSCGTTPIPDGGGESTRTIIRGAPSETVILKPPPTINTLFTLDVERYLTFQNLIVDGTDHTGFDAISMRDNHEGGAAPYRLRFQDMEFRNMWGGVGGPSGYRPYGAHEFINIDIHDVQKNLTCYEGNCGHVFYTHGDDHLFDRVVIDAAGVGNTANYCFHIYDGSYTPKNGWIIRNSTLKNCKNHAIGCYACNDAIFENNVIHGPSSGGSGIVLGYSNRTQIRNNTIYGVAGEGIYLTPGTQSVIKNNILSNNGGVGISVEGGNNIAIQNNLAASNGGGACVDVGGNHGPSGTNACTGSSATGNLFGNFNPLFVNAANRDFRLQVGSPARDAGQAIAGLTTDKDGIMRPQGSKYDIGAYEYRSSTLNSPANFRMIDISK